MTNKMNEDFVTYEQAVKLKELGFDWECNRYYDYNHKLVEYIINDFGQYSAPTLSQVQKWLREVKRVKVYVKPLFSSEEYEYCISFKFRGYGGDEDYGVKDTWESALLSGIDEAIKLIKKEELRNKRWYET